MSTGGHSPAGMLGVGAGVTLVVMLCRSYEHSAGVGRQPAAPCRVVGSGLAAAQHDDGLPLRDILLPRLHALLARAHGDAAAYAHFRDRYRDMAKTLGFEGHIEWADAMP
jgi:hypothetical protein